MAPVAFSLAPQVLIRLILIVASLGLISACGEGSRSPASAHRNASGRPGQNQQLVVHTVERSNLSKDSVAQRVDDFFSTLVFIQQGERCYAASAFARDLVGQDQHSRGEVRKMLTEALYGAFRVEKTTADISVGIATEVNGLIESQNLVSLRALEAQGQSPSVLTLSQGVRARNWGPRRDLHYLYQVGIKVSPDQSRVDLKFDVSQASYDPAVTSVMIQFARAENVLTWTVKDFEYPDASRRLVERSCGNRPLNQWFQR